MVSLLSRAIGSNKQAGDFLTPPHDYAALRSSGPGLSSTLIQPDSRLSNAW
jgi:hypothetical protein